MNKAIHRVASIRRICSRTGAWTTALAVALGMSLSCSTMDAPRFSSMRGPVYYTQVNIRYEDPERIPSTNYLRGERLPVGTPVRIIERGGRTIRFVDPSDREYSLLHVPRHTAGTLDQIFERMFSREDPWAPGGTLDRIASASVDHIEQGTVGGGMTRQAALMSYGYPPSHRTPSLEQDVWTYWIGRNRTQLEFRKDRLLRVDGVTLPQPVRLFAVSSPSGAMVESEGRLAGQTPCMLTVTVHPETEPGQHKFRVTPGRPDTPRFGILASGPSPGATVGDTIVVQKVMPLSTAHQMGVQPGDRILSINGARVRSESECAEIVASIGFGAPLTVVVQRNNSEKTLQGETETPAQGTFHAQEKTFSTHELLDMHDHVLFFDLAAEPDPEDRSPATPPLEQEPSE